MRRRKSKLDTLIGSVRPDTTGIPRAERNGIRTFQPVKGAPSGPYQPGREERPGRVPKRPRARTTGRRWS